VLDKRSKISVRAIDLNNTVIALQLSWHYFIRIVINALSQLFTKADEFCGKCDCLLEFAILKFN
jgi:hypothetical protein